jgi:pilus assembly protein CpaF
MFGKRSATNIPVPAAPPPPKPDGQGSAPSAPQPPKPPKESPIPTAPPAPPLGSAPGAPAPPAPIRRNRVSKEKVEQFNALKMRLHRKLIDQLDLTRMVGDEETIRAQVREVVSQLADQENTLLNLNERQRLISEVLDETFGLGPLEVLLGDPSINDILVNGPKQVYVERRGKLELTEVEFRDNGHLMHVIDKIVTSVGRRCDETSPMVDARLRDGSRVNAIIQPLAIDGATLSIRRFGSDPITWDDYLAFRSCPEEVRDFLHACVESRLNILVVGGTGSGKTTLLNNLSSFIPDDERIVTIEDAAELQLRQPHVVRLETRPPNIEGKGRIAIRELLINALRMRPDRIVVGECRGAETLDMLQAMNTGHDGSLTTLHANSTRDTVTRVETMVMMAGFELPVRAIRQQFSSAVHLLVNCQRITGGARKIVNVTEVSGMEGDTITMQDIFQFEQLGLSRHGRAIGQFVATGIRPTFLNRLAALGCPIDPAMFSQRVLMMDEPS